MSEDSFDFRDQVQSTDWYPLEIHFKNDALFLVSEQLDLSDVGAAIRDDNSSQVKQWLDEQKLLRPTMEQVELWREDPYRQIGRFIIVAPYVFLQLGLTQ